MVTEPVSDGAILKIRGLETRFARKVVHKNLALDVRRGEVLVLIGGSGTGKSTLLRLLIGLEAPYAGSCEFHSEDIFAFSERQWVPVRQKIAYAFQSGALFDGLTVEENLLYPLREHLDLSEAEARGRVAEMLGRFGLEATLKLYPAALSGGMQKRIGLARAIMLDPEVILYDEPTAGLDPTNTTNIVSMILALKATGKTSVVVTHDPTCIDRVADRIAMIQDGAVVADQAIDAVRSTPDPHIDAYLKGAKH